MALQTRKGNPNKPPRIMIYGVEGVGKSTFGAKAERPIFISPEGGTDRLRNASNELVDEITGIATWLDVRNAVKTLITEKHDFQTVVLDSADWIEKLCHQFIIGQSGKSITTVNGGYGAGYRQSEILHKELIEDISQLREKRNMNIVITAHAHVKPVKDPSMMEDYDSFEIKTHEMVSSLWREWVDALFFVRFKTFIKTSEESDKARALSDGTRVLYTVKQPSFQAKNRYGMKPEYDFTENFWNEFSEHRKQVTPSQDETNTLDLLRSELNELWLQIKDETLQTTVRNTVLKAGNDVQKLNVILNRLKELKKGAA